MDKQLKMKKLLCLEIYFINRWKVNHEDRRGGFFLPPRRVIVPAEAQFSFILTIVILYNSEFLIGWGLFGLLEAYGWAGDRFFKLYN